GSRPGEAENGLFLVGFETDPDVVAARQGTVTYDATLVVSGVFNDDATLTNQNLGTALFTADFDDNMVSGDFSVNVGDGGMALALAPTAISGNGFAGDLQITACGSANCTSNSDVAGVFFGPNAEELNGIAQFDVSATDASGNTDSFVGSGVIINGD
ncbi:MAG: transferrin-binding protein-like solute binding protein, partial [Pseudomonadota bacterium]